MADYKQLRLFRLLDEIDVLSESDEELSDKADQEYKNNFNTSIDDSLSDDSDSLIFEEPDPSTIIYADGVDPDLDRDPESIQIIKELINSGRQDKPLCTFKSSRSSYPVYAEDLKKLSPKSSQTRPRDIFLNDSLIDFFLRYIVENVKTPRNIMLYDCIFYQRFKIYFRTRPQKLKSKQSIFGKEFLIIPVCERNHWLLYVCCFLPSLRYRFAVRGFEKVSHVYCYSHRKNLPYPVYNTKYKRACLLVFDSLGKGYIDHDKIFKHIREYLSYEWNSTFSKKLNFNEHNLPQYIVPAPTQENGYDCGVFVMYYTIYFIKDLMIYRTRKMPPDMSRRFKTVSSNLRYELVKLFEVIIKKQRSKQVDEEKEDDMTMIIQTVDEDGVVCID